MEVERLITAEDKRILQREISMKIKDFRGVGPQSHVIKDLGNELEITVKGTLVPVEKYFFQTYGQEYINAVYKFYFETVELAVKQLDDALNNKYQLSLIRWEPDFLNDSIKWVLQYTQS